MKITKKNIIKYILVGLVLCIITYSLTKISFSADVPVDETKIQKIMHYLSDCTLIPGIFLMLFYALAWVANQGIFDGIGYASRFVGAMFIPNLKMYKGRDGFYQYKQSKVEKRKESLNHDALIVGIGYFILGIIFYILYYVL